MSRSMPIRPAALRAAPRSGTRGWQPDINTTASHAGGHLGFMRNLPLGQSPWDTLLDPRGFFTRPGFSGGVGEMASRPQRQPGQTS